MSTPKTSDRTAIDRLLWVSYVVSLIVNDAIFSLIGFRLAFWIRFELNLAFFRLSVSPPPDLYEQLSFALPIVWTLMFAVTGLYQKGNLLGGTVEYALVFRGTTAGMLLLIIAGFLEPNFTIARGWILLSWILVFLLISSGRFWLRRLVYWLRTRGYLLEPALIIGANDEGYLLAEQILNWKTSGFELVGIVKGTVNEVRDLDDVIPIVGTLDEVASLVEHFRVKELVLATSALSREDTINIYEQFGSVDHINLRMSSGLFEVITTGLEVSQMAYIPLVKINKVRLTGIDKTLKLAIDYGLSIPGALLLLPLLVLIGLIIRIDSPGPIIHRRRVLGMHGQEFHAFKFRTMVVNGDQLLAENSELLEELATNHKIKEDPRITRVGHFLRKFSLDELPQLVNVLRGEMSLVGPRMISPVEITKYQKWGMNLLTVRPGITGLWQVSGRSDINYEERVRLDMYYIRNWSIWLDLQLLIRTIPAVLSKRGAY